MGVAGLMDGTTPLLIGKRIEYLSEFDMDDKGTEQEPRWCSGVVQRICEGTWVIPGKMRKCWKEGEAVEVFWDVIPDADMPACRDKVALNPNKWNKDHMVYVIFFQNKKISNF